MKLNIFVALIISFILITLSNTSVYAGHGNSRVGETYCNASDNKIYVNLPNNQHNNTGRACGTEEVFGQVVPPSPIQVVGYGATGIKNFLTTIIKVIYIISAVVFLFMFIFASWQFITSGGDKESVAGARKRITYAIIGLVLLALAFLFVRVFGNILGFSFFG